MNWDVFSGTITLMNKANHPLLSIIAFFVLTLFVFIPGTIYLTNSMEFTNSYLELLLAGICLSLIVALIFLLIFRVLRSAAPRFLEKGLALVFGLGFLIWFQGNFLLWNYGPLDGRLIPWAAMKFYGFLDGGIWIAVLAAAFIFSPFFLRFARRVCLILVFIQLAYGAFLFLKQPETPSFQKYTVDITNKFVFSKNRNLILVVLDSFQTDVFNEIIQENPDLLRALDGFTYFRNSLGGYSTTELSVALMLTGKFYDNSLPFEQWKRDAYMSASIPHVLKSAGWQVDIYPDVSYSLYYSDAIASNFVLGVPFSEKMLAIAQIYDLTLFRCLPHFLKPLVYNNQAWLLKGLALEVLRKSKAREIHSTRVTRPGVKRKRRNRQLFSRKAYQGSAVVRFFDQMLFNSGTIDTRGTFKFYHLMIPHIPLLLDEQFGYRVMPVNRRNYTIYATAAVKLIGIFMEHLKEMGIHDDSLVIIMGDHGAGHQGQRFELNAGMPTRPGATAVSEANRVSAMPLILVKPLSAHGELKVSDAPVSLGDVTATAFSGLGFAARAPGTPMFTVDPEAPRQRRFLVYDQRDIFSYYGDMIEYFISGYGWLDESWQPSGRVFTRHGVVMLNQ